MIKNKIIRLFLFVCCLYVPPCFGMFTIDDVDPETHRMHYNSLSAVEVADKELNSRSNFQDFLSRAELLVVSHGLEDVIGLRLIHRHFDLDSGRIMVENFGMYKEIPSLITSAHLLSVAREKGSVPASWMFIGEQQMMPFEFSTDTATRSGIKRLVSAPSFLTEMRSLLKENHLQDLIAVAIMKKESLVGTDGDFYLEKNFCTPDESVVQLEHGDNSTTENNILTGWTFAGPKTVGCRISGTKCTKVGSRHINTPTHVKW